jgi:hypothetical protein
LSYFRVCRDFLCCSLFLPSLLGFRTWITPKQYLNIQLTMSSLQLSTRASQGSSITIDSFQTFSASKGSESESRLERHRRARKPIPDIATALSPSGWLATASYDKVRFYRLGDTDRSAREIKENRESIKCHREWGKIRAIAISNDLLAIITYSHLIVLEYRVHGNIDQILVDTKLINPSEAWTPQSVAIRQVKNLGAGLVPISWIAVGGQGKHGVKVYKYTYSAGWDAQSDRITLSCAQNASSIRLVGFSPDRPNTRDQVIVFGAADSNRIYCWGLGWENENRTPEPSWIFNCDVRKGGVVSTAPQNPQRPDLMEASRIGAQSNRPKSFYPPRGGRTCSVLSIKGKARKYSGAALHLLTTRSETSELYLTLGKNYQGMQSEEACSVGP